MLCHLVFFGSVNDDRSYLFFLYLSLSSSIFFYGFVRCRMGKKMHNWLVTGPESRRICCCLGLESYFGPLEGI